MAGCTIVTTYQKLLAEFLGTFALIFAGTGAIVVNSYTNALNDGHGGVIGHPGIAITFGLIVMVVIYAIGETSGAHINPAVSIGFAVSGRFPWNQVPGYIVAQVAGALAASLFLRICFPEDETSLGATLPEGSLVRAFVFEVFLTSLLMSVVLFVSTGSRETGMMAGIAVGGLIALEAMFAGPITGASMNPARSIGPAVVSLNVGTLWIYIAAPILGAVMGWALFVAVRPNSQSESPSRKEEARKK